MSATVPTILCLPLPFAYRALPRVSIMKELWVNRKRRESHNFDAREAGLHGTPLSIAVYTGAQLRLVAGPGTGETFALMRRAVRLLEQNVLPNEILALAYTRTAGTSEWTKRRYSGKSCLAARV